MMLKIVLAVSGLLFLLAGFAILLDPNGFYAAYQLGIPFNTNWQNELRANGSLLIATGTLIAAGALIEKFSRVSLYVGLIQYGAIVLGRLLSLLVDGTPQHALLVAMMLEAFTWLALLTAFIRSVRSGQGTVAH